MPSLTTDLVRSYLKEIGRYPLLTPEQEITNARLVQQMMAIEQQRQAIALQLNREPTARELATSFQKYRKTLREDSRILLDQYQIVDVAMKVVGVGSIGTRCGVALLVTGDNDPLFLQIKEARASVLEPYAGKSTYENHAQRIVAGQHLMQEANDIFLGWTKGDSGHDFYLRQLRDMKTSVEIEGMSQTDLRGYSHLCGWALAHSHARSGNRFAISGYLGQSDTFERAIANFAVAYADQTEADYKALADAVAAGQIKAIEE